MTTTMSPLSGFSDTFRKKAPILDHHTLSSVVTTAATTTTSFSSCASSAAASSESTISGAVNSSCKMVETKKPYTEHTDAELADLATQEISLDLHGLIDDSQFTDENLFGDLMETAKKNDAANHWLNAANGGNNNGLNGGMVRGQTPSSGGSSGQNSPVGNGSDGQGSPLQHNQFNGGYVGGYGNVMRNPLAYLPGSVHAAGFNQITQQSINQNIQVKQEPMESEYSSCAQAQSTTRPLYPMTNGGMAGGQHGQNSGSCTQSQGVSSTTNYILPDQFSPQQSPNSQQCNGGTSTSLPFAAMNNTLSTLKSFSNSSSHQQQPKYLLQKKKIPPPQMPGSPLSPNIGPNGEVIRSTDEYRRRRERNNVAVRKSREKAKLRSRETEERVKILARENDRLQKKNELLQEELGVLRSLFSSVGVLPEHVQREVAKHLESFQAQHAAINY